MKPLEKFDAPPLVPLPELSTTKPGKFFDSLPNPYTVQAPSVGRPTCIAPLNSRSWPG